jgi:hypothetical protein
VKKKIVVNSKEMRVAATYLTFEDVVRFAVFLGIGPTFDAVTYKYRNTSGLLIPGQSVELLDGMIFKLARTGSA